MTVSTQPVFKIYISLMTFASLTLFQTRAYAADAVPTSEMTSSLRLQWNGSGCAKLEEKVATTLDSIAVKKSFDPIFKVRRGTGIGLGESRKNCALIVTPPEGQQIAIEKIEIAGDIKLPAGANLNSALEVSSQGQSASKTYAFDGTKAGEAKYETAKVIEDKEQVWSVCGRSLTANLKERIEGASQDPAEALITSINLNVRTRACTK